MKYIVVTGGVMSGLERALPLHPLAGTLKIKVIKLRLSRSTLTSILMQAP